VQYNLDPLQFLKGYIIIGFTLSDACIKIRTNEITDCSPDFPRNRNISNEVSPSEVILIS
jgi:hypothetical protein